MEPATKHSGLVLNAANPILPSCVVMQPAHPGTNGVCSVISHARRHAVTVHATGTQGSAGHAQTLSGVSRATKLV
ncbi:hypothetical protein DPMN_038702 [Dreissena polymorpha]|uniref:Uncharacterized protein n=1 Tax=Dreissena polymorpha TaxID=45954 RepID=A0A9D4MFS9_DREPO|nr:hypothetical protein DPMN_038702 [Dreissena polymorpha]